MFSKFNQAFQVGNMNIPSADFNNNSVVTPTTTNGLLKSTHGAASAAVNFNAYGNSGSHTAANLNLSSSSSSTSGINLSYSFISDSGNVTPPCNMTTVAATAELAVSDESSSVDVNNAPEQYVHMDDDDNDDEDEEEDDNDSLNLNFDDFNDQSDMEDGYYTNCPSDQTPNSNSNVCGGAGSSGIDDGDKSGEQPGSILYDDFEQQLAAGTLNTAKLASMHHLTHLNHQLNQHQLSQAATSMLTPSSSVSPNSSSASSMLEAISELENSLNETYFAGTSTSAGASKSINRNMHCIKEKIRRDRIKMSCKQLRRLIPNVNGFKTDMASLLETSVLWIQLLNANVPEQYLNNIKAKLASLASLKNMQQHMQMMPNDINLLSQKCKTNYEYLLGTGSNVAAAAAVAATTIQPSAQQQLSQRHQIQQAPPQMSQTPLQLQNLLSKLARPQHPKLHHQYQQQQQQQIQLQKQALQQQAKQQQKAQKQQQQLSTQSLQIPLPQLMQQQQLLAQQQQPIQISDSLLQSTSPLAYQLLQANLLSSINTMQQHQFDLTNTMDMCQQQQQTLGSLPQQQQQQPPISLQQTSPISLKPNAWLPYSLMTNNANDVSNHNHSNHNHNNNNHHPQNISQNRTAHVNQTSGVLQQQQQQQFQPQPHSQLLQQQQLTPYVDLNFYKKLIKKTQQQHQQQQQQNSLNFNHR